MDRPAGANQSKWPVGANETVERMSAYRFFDQEVVGFANGGGLQWRVGDVGTVARFSTEVFTRGCHWLPRLLA
jgi:hypothetical protein